MNQWNNSCKFSAKTGSKIIDNPNISFGLPGHSNYNPHVKKDGYAAKLWELLRRNPWFRECASDVCKLNLKSSAGRKQFNNKFQKLDCQNPFAGLALRWLFRPKYQVLNFPRLSGAESGFVALNFPWISEDWQSLLEVVQEITAAEIRGEIFAGPLTISPSLFCLDTPWLQTPELFQFLFHWLWQDFEIDLTKKTGEIEKDGKPQGIEFDSQIKTNASLHFSCGEILERDVIYGGNIKSVLNQSKNFFKLHKVFAVPRTVMTHKMEKEIRHKFNELLEGMRSVANQKYANFLGAENDWLIFDYCRSKISYEKDPKHPDREPQRMGFGMAKTNFIKMQKESGNWSENSKWDAHVQDHYKLMEECMFAVFPKFDFARLLRTSHEVNTIEFVTNASVTGLAGALNKIRSIAAFFPEKQS